MMWYTAFKNKLAALLFYQVYQKTHLPQISLESCYKSLSLLLKRIQDQISVPCQKKKRIEHSNVANYMYMMQPRYLHGITMADGNMKSCINNKWNYDANNIPVYVQGRKENLKSVAEFDYCPFLKVAGHQWYYKDKT